MAIGFGSIRHDDPTRFAREVMDDLRRAERGGVLLVEWSRLSAPGDGDALAVGEAPLDELLPKAAAIVRHGGVGTVGAVLHSGTPQVINPFFGDQPFQAGRLRELGVAPHPLMCITGEAPAEGLRTADALANTTGALDEVMADEDGCAAAIARINQVLDRGGSVGSR